MPRAVLPRRHGHRIRHRLGYILFFCRLDSKRIFIFLLYQFIDSIESLRPPPPPTTRPPRICAGSGVSIKSMVVLFVGCGCVAETRKNVLFLRIKSAEG